MKTTSLEAEDVHEALGGNEDAQRRLVARLVPVIQGRVSWRLLTYGGPRSRQMAEDLTQDILLCLFDHDAKILRGWDPRRGTLEHFVGMVTQLRVCSLLRGRGRHATRERSIDDLPLEPHSDGDLERQVAARQRLRYLIASLNGDLNRRDWRLFEALFLDERCATEVGLELDMSVDAIYQWRSRFRKKARRLMAAIDPGGEAAAREGDG